MVALSGASSGQQTLNNLGNISGATSVPFGSGSTVKATLTGNVTFTFTGALAGVACTLNFYLTQDGTGGRAVTWPGSVSWIGGTPPTPVTTAGALNVYVFTSLDGGTTWIGALVQELSSSSSADMGTGGPTNAGLGTALQTMPLMACNAQTGGISSKRALWMLATANEAATVTKLGCVLTGAGVTPDGSGINGLGIFTESGTLLSNTGDMTTAFESTGVAEGTLGASQSLVAGTNYWLCLVSAFSGTVPQFMLSTGAGNYPEINGHFTSVINTSYTAWASFTPGSQSSNQSWIYVYAR